MVEVGRKRKTWLFADMQTAVISTVVSTIRSKGLAASTPGIWRPPNSPSGRQLHSPVANQKFYTAHSVGRTKYKKYDHYSSPSRDDRRPSTPSTSRPTTPKQTKPKVKKPLIKNIARDYSAAKEEDKQKTSKGKRNPKGKNDKKAAKTTTSASTRKKKHCVIV